MKLNVVAGLVLGLLSVAILYVCHWTGWLRTPAGENGLPLATGLLHILLLIWALRRHRNLARPEGVPFARLFGAGLLISLVGGITVAFGNLLLTQVLDPGFFDWAMERARFHLAEQMATMEGLTEADRQARLAILDAATPEGFAVQRMVQTLILGAFLSLPVAALVRLRSLKSDF
ncbi:MAG: DUF4199 domain-containing protein [Acidobacteriota bacterium]